MKYALFVLAGIAVGALSIAGYVRSQIAAIPEPSFHEHADFAVFLNGKRFDFARGEFMNNKPCTLQTNSGWINAAMAHGLDLEDAVHLHDNIGSVVHVHREGITWHEFFESLRMGLENDLFVDHEGNQYKADASHAFVFIVNGQKVDELADWPIRDADRVLISYGRANRAEQEIWAEYGQVSNDACLSSGTCKHRGFTPIESCGLPAQATPKLLKWLDIK